MTQSQTKVHLSRYCQMLVVSSTQWTIDVMKHLANIASPGVMRNSAKDGSPPFKVILSAFDPSVVDLVAQGRNSQHPVSLVILDAQGLPEPSAEHMTAALLGADAELHILILVPKGAPPGRRLLHSMSQSNRLALLRMPCDEIELGQLVRVMLAKWLAERSGASAGSASHHAAGSENRLAPWVATLKASAQISETHSAKPVTTILAAEDDETLRWMISKVLATHHFNVLTATNADEAWHQWRQNRNTIKLVITDINMPGGPNGVALGQAIQDEDGSVPVIYTSGHRAVHEFAELRAGTNYLVKPFRMNELMDMVGRALAAKENLGIGAARGTRE